MTDNYEYAIAWNRRLLKPIGIWPLEGLEYGRPGRVERIIRRVMTSCVLGAYMIPQYMYASTKPNIDEYLPTMAPMMFDLLTMIKFVILMLNDAKIGDCLTCMREDWENVSLTEDHETMMSSAKFGRYMTICCFGCMYSGIVFYDVVLPHLDIGVTSTAANSTATEKLALPYPVSYLFFDVESTPTYEITWLVQLVGSTYMCILNCGGYGFICTLVAHACGQLRVIGSQLDDVIDGRRKETRTVEERIIKIVEHHLRVIRYVQHINQSLQVTFLAEELGALGVICFSGYAVLTVTLITMPVNWNSDNSALGTVIWTFITCALIFNFFVISMVAQQLWSESEAVSIATARVQWYRLPPKVSRCLIMCMARSARPLKLLACNMFDMSLANFGDVLRGSLIFLNMLRKLTAID